MGQCAHLGGRRHRPRHRGRKNLRHRRLRPEAIRQGRRGAEHCGQLCPIPCPRRHRARGQGTHQLFGAAVFARCAGYGAGAAAGLWGAGLPVRRAAGQPAGVHAALLCGAAHRQALPPGVPVRDAAAGFAVYGRVVKLRRYFAGLLLYDAGAADRAGMERADRAVLHAGVCFCQRHQAVYQPAVGAAAADGAQARVEGKAKPRRVVRQYAGGQPGADAVC